jgi:hypothetical protein
MHGLNQCQYQIGNNQGEMKLGNVIAKNCSYFFFERKTPIGT